MTGSVDWDPKIGCLRPTFEDYLSDATRLHRERGGDVVIDRSLLYRLSARCPLSLVSATMN